MIMKYQKRIARTKIMQAGIAFSHQFGYHSVQKQCTSCYDWRFLNEYYPSPIGYLGLMPVCKLCANKQYHIGYREKQREGKVFEGYWKIKNYNTKDNSYDLITDPKVLEVLEEVVYRQYGRSNHMVDLLETFDPVI